MRSPEQLDLPSPRRQSLNNPIDLIGLVRRCPHLSHNYITVNPFIEQLRSRLALDADQAMLLTVIKPMACTTRSNNPLQLVGLHPYQLIHSFIILLFKALAAQLHRPSCHLSASTQNLSVNTQVLTHNDRQEPRLPIRKYSRRPVARVCPASSFPHRPWCRRAAPCGCPRADRP